MYRDMAIMLGRCNIADGSVHTESIQLETGACRPTKCEELFWIRVFNMGDPSYDRQRVYLSRTKLKQCMRPFIARLSCTKRSQRQIQIEGSQESKENIQRGDIYLKELSFPRTSPTLHRCYCNWLCLLHCHLDDAFRGSYNGTQFDRTAEHVGHSMHCRKFSVVQRYRSRFFTMNYINQTSWMHLDASYRPLDISI